MAKKKKMTLEEKLEEAIVKDGPHEVPGNWVHCKWGCLGEFIAGTGFKPAYQGKIGLDIPFYKVGNLKNVDNYGYINCADNTITEEDRKELKAKLISANALVFAKVGEAIRLNRRALLEKEACIDNNMMSFSSNKRVSYRYVYYFSQTLDLYDISNSTTVPSIRKSDLQDITIPLPPLKEQQKIVDRIESLFKKLDKAKVLIEEAREGFQKRKAAILEKAFRGELTKEWRINNISPIYGKSYLECISEERNRIFSNLIEESKKMKLKKPTKIHNVDLKYEKINSCETWIKTKLYNVLYDFRYGTSNKSDYSFEGRSVIRIPNLNDGYITHIDMKYLKENDIDVNHKVKTGDLVIVRSNGSPLLVGKTSLITELENDFAFASYLIRMRPCGVESKYLYYVLNSVGVKEQFYSKSKSTSGINNINTEELGNSIIPLPPLEEQKEIVRILDKLLEEESKIEELTQLEEQIELIKKSILAKAFRGELGTNCEEDESALELLKEILSKQ